MREVTIGLRARIERVPWLAWAALGTLGTILMAVAASDVGAVPHPMHYKWFLPTLVHGHALGYVVLYAGIALLALSWLALGPSARSGVLTVRRAALTVSAWALPLAVGVPLFSRDIYSYVAQGQLAHHGLNPYHVGAAALGPGPVFDSVSFVWQHTPSPYGPLFVTLTNLLTGIDHSFLVQILAVRLLAIVGLALCATFLVGLARELHANAARALWLGVMSPLSLFSSVASAHNDVLMIALLLGGLLAWRRGHLHLAIALIAVASAVKLPALAGLAVIAIAEIRRRRGTRVLVEVVVVVGVVLSALTLLNGFGWWWASPQALSLASELRTAATPTTSLGVLVSRTLHGLGAHSLVQRSVVTQAQRVGDVVSAGAVIYALARVRSSTLVRTLGAILLVLVLGGPTLWPWYLLWGLSVLAATGAQSSGWLAAAAAFAGLIVGPGGQPMLGGNAYLVVSPLVLAGIIAFVRYQRRRDILGVPDDVN